MRKKNFTNIDRNNKNLAKQKYERRICYNELKNFNEIDR